MTAHYLRVINQQQLYSPSILLDKIDECQGTVDNASKIKQKIYVPYKNPVDTSVKGYIDLVPSDNIILQSQTPNGVIYKMAAKGLISTATITAAQIATPVITAAVHNSPLAGELTITGTTFLSVSPDHTYVKLTNLSGVSQTLSDTQIAANQISDLVTLTNQIKTNYNAHAASTVFHTVADTVNAPVVVANATSLATAITLLNALRTAYEAHRVRTAGPVHGAADNTNSIVAAAATDLASALTLSEDLKAKFNAHIILTAGGVHLTSGAVNTVTALNGDSFTNTSIKVTIVAGGPVAAGWLVQILANSKWSNIYTVT